MRKNIYCEKKNICSENFYFFFFFFGIYRKKISFATKNFFELLHSKTQKEKNFEKKIKKKKKKKNV